MGSKEHNQGKLSGPSNDKSKASFMFHNYTEDWSVGKLWRCFKKYGTVYDVFMVGKRLKNGQKFCFVRYNNIIDMDKLIYTLGNIQIGSEKIKVYKAYEKREGEDKSRYRTGGRFGGNNKFTGGGHEGFHDQGRRFNSSGNGGINIQGVRDARRYNEVVIGGGYDLEKGAKRSIMEV